VLQFLSEQLTQALPLATYPAAQLHTPLFNVKVEKQAVAAVKVHAEAPLAHYVQTPLFNPYPAKQVKAVVLDEQVYAPVPQATHVLLKI